MAKIDEMSVLARIGILALIVAALGAGFYYWKIKPITDDTTELQQRITQIKGENARLREFEPKLAEIAQQMAAVQRELEQAQKIVPSEKDADQFIRLIHDTAAIAGIEVRRYTAMPVANKGFYTEVPFQIDLDGSYDSVVKFFDHMARMERIVNVDNLQMANTKNTSSAKVKTAYSWGPGETVVASCTAKTFFSHDQQEVAPKAPVTK